MHDALHVHDYRLDRTGEQGQFLAEEIAGHRHPLAHQDLVGSTADTAQVDADRALRSGIFNQFRVLSRRNNHLRERRLVTVDDYIDLLLFQDPKIDLGHRRAGCAEQDV